VELVAVADPDLLHARATLLGRSLTLTEYDPTAEPRPATAGELLVKPVALLASCLPGSINPANGPYVLETLRHAVKGCLAGEFNAMLTAPVQKSAIAESGTPFSGHTEFLARSCDADTPVMLLCADTLRVALLTTHYALADVPAQITKARIVAVCRVLAADMHRLFGIGAPRIAVLGLNPHAGEAGQLGREELEIIGPAIAELQREGLNLTGPLPADSAFTPAALENFDVVLAMYHDQGLPVLKHAGFGKAVNVTLGLPIIRTSVDHGTALELAGTGMADGGSLQAALDMATEFSGRSLV
jgi:4-hydroxythreonine-4-phosphate dehydrogenase